MSRVQLALNVADLEASVAFYATMFGIEPHKRRPGYANFAVENPPLKLVLIEVPATDRGTGAAGALNHLGVEVGDTGEVAAATQRLAAAGLATFEENDTTCCYALQDKVWVSGPDRTDWEVYTVLADAQGMSPVAAADGTACCASTQDASQDASQKSACC